MTIDVEALNDEQRAHWELRASWYHRPLRRPHGDYYLSHWLRRRSPIGRSLPTVITFDRILRVYWANDIELDERP